MGKRLNLVGRRFGHFYVLSSAGVYRSPFGQTFTKWLCQCDCGRTTEVLGYSLTRGTSTNCGCEHGRTPPLQGTFGHLQILSTLPLQKGKERQYHCQCTCGKRVN